MSSYLDDRRAALSAHPNWEAAVATVAGQRYQSHWEGIWIARPYLLELTNTCPKCEARPFAPCSTPTGYGARTHMARLRELGYASYTDFILRNDEEEA